MYDFDNAPQRLHTDSVKWDVKDGELPMWIADMDFQTAPEIVAAMQAKLQLGAFGYEEPHDTYFEAVAGWYARQHHAQPDTDWLNLSTGVVPAISSIVRRVSNVGDNVLVQAPVYNIFYNSIENNGRHVLSSDLVYDGSQYSVDWTDLEAKLAQPLTTLMILCNPHNPVGKVWSESELTRIATLCQTHHVVMVSDEIHGDLVLNGPDYTPAFSLPAPLNQNVISLVSPSKTFNVAAMHVATVIVPNADLRSVVNRGLNTDELAEPNLLAIPGTIAAYTKGDAWLASLKTKLNQNYQLAVDYLAANVPAVKVVQSTATYLMWLDVSAITDDADALTASIRKTTGLILSSGSVYRGNGPQFLRLNFACPTAMLQDGLKRLKRGIETFQS
ncbi:cystathionine beta-lyase PatB [Secundilactobacillus odoratitofui DSM 19909 = JCM 15043]|uniref:cysteine-S-conjugate beta-lyase n=1 Tax=Secundilactobacillus odoratitofui DSM 19909 = JCM 15043 TaxID=1423776 RepID=A0A0R1LPM4_9LACO|nr:MalY/PatB family protein [Secundilactobacillus odoratitofui]KRK97820.1 cystathionine beta-lyase PatB [Secundilactobacillus odoratitofui DSM 19909 = JCM 15043]